MSENFLDKGDKELDEFLKKISDAAEVPFSEEDWVAMESRLDKSTPPRPVGWKRNIFLGTAVLLLAGMIGYWVWNQEEPVPLDSSRLSTAGQATEGQKEGSIQDVPHTVDAELPIPDQETIPAKRNAGTKKSIPTSNSSPAIDQIAVAEEPNQIRAVPNLESREAEKAAPKPIPEGMAHLQQASADHGQSATASIDTLSSDLTSANEAPLTSSSDDPKQGAKKAKERFGGKFNLSVQLAPDLSAIQLDHLGKAGNMVGIGAEYFFLPQISLSSGVFYSYKPYSGDSGYQLNYGKTPSYVIGACDILDIPFNIRFYALEGKVQRFFISTGLSTYLMLKEHYELEYHQQNTGTSYFRDIDVAGANQHYFGIVNISMGYERKLGRQLGVQVEPYFKVPLSGVGEGDVSLKSMGIFVGLKYYPGKR